jgi:hypothetical protein
VTPLVGPLTNHMVAQDRGASTTISTARYLCSRLAAFQHTHDRPDTDAQLGGDPANARAVLLVESAADCFLGLLVDLRPSQSRPFCLGPGEPGTDTFLDHGPLKLGKDPHHLEHSRTGRGGRIDPLLVQIKVDPERMNFGQKGYQVLQGPAEPIDRPGHDHVELALGRVSAQRIELWTLVPAFGTADAVILVNFGDLVPLAGRDLAKFALLVRGGLIDSRNPQIQCGLGRRMKLTEKPAATGCWALAASSGTGLIRFTTGLCARVPAIRMVTLPAPTLPTTRQATKHKTK